MLEVGFARFCGVPRKKARVAANCSFTGCSSREFLCYLLFDSHEHILPGLYLLKPSGGLLLLGLIHFHFFLERSQIILKDLVPERQWVDQRSLYKLPKRLRLLHGLFVDEAAAAADFLQKIGEALYKLSWIFGKSHSSKCLFVHFLLRFLTFLALLNGFRRLNEELRKRILIE